VLCCTCRYRLKTVMHTHNGKGSPKERTGTTCPPERTSILNCTLPSFSVRRQAKAPGYVCFCYILRVSGVVRRTVSESNIVPQPPTYKQGTGTYLDLPNSCNFGIMVNLNVLVLFVIFCRTKPTLDQKVKLYACIRNAAFYEMSLTRVRYSSMHQQLL
jgi:hypothetical protein